MFSISLTVRVLVLFALHFKNRCVNCVLTHINPEEGSRQKTKKLFKKKTANFERTCFFSFDFVSYGNVWQVLFSFF